LNSDSALRAPGWGNSWWYPHSTLITLPTGSRHQSQIDQPCPPAHSPVCHLHGAISFAVVAEPAIATSGAHRAPARSRCTPAQRTAPTTRENAYRCDQPQARHGIEHAHGTVDGTVRERFGGSICCEVYCVNLLFVTVELEPNRGRPDARMQPAITTQVHRRHSGPRLVYVVAALVGVSIAGLVGWVAAGGDASSWALSGFPAGAPPASPNWSALHMKAKMPTATDTLRSVVARFVNSAMTCWSTL
jgi:hypothetical protein